MQGHTWALNKLLLFLLRRVLFKLVLLPDVIGCDSGRIT